MSEKIIQLNEELIKNNLKELVRDSVEETLNALLDHEADELVKAEKYERTESKLLSVQVNKLRLDVLLLNGCCAVAKCFGDGVAI